MSLLHPHFIYCASGLIIPPGGYTFIPMKFMLRAMYHSDDAVGELPVDVGLDSADRLQC